MALEAPQRWSLGSAGLAGGPRAEFGPSRRQSFASAGPSGSDFLGCASFTSAGAQGLRPSGSFASASFTPGGAGGSSRPGSFAVGIGEAAQFPFGSGRHAAFQLAETQLLSLAGDAEFRADEEQLFELLASAHHCAVDLERDPPTDPREVEDAKRIAHSILRMCVAWLRFASCGSLAEGAPGLRGTAAAELVCGSIVAVVASDSPVAVMLLPAFCDMAGLAHLGLALCCMEELALAGGVRRLRLVAARCRALCHSGALPAESLAGAIEAFRTALFERICAVAAQRGRRLRVPQFKELVSELGGVMGGAYPTSEIFESGCRLSLRLSLQLCAFCPGVPEADALEAIDWMALVLRNLLDQTVTVGALSSPSAIRGWIEDSGLWSTLVWRAGCRTQQQAHQLLVVLLSWRALAPCDLVGALAAIGALSPSAVPTASRLAIQGALLAAVPSLGPELLLDLFGELCAVLGYAHLHEESIDLLARLTQQALNSGYDPGGAGDAMGLARSLAVSQLLRFLQWGHRQEAGPDAELLDFARRALLHTLAPHPALAPLLPAISAEALSLAAAPPGSAGAAAVSRCARALCGLAVDVAGMAAGAAAGAPDVARLTAVAAARICSAFPPGGVEPPFGAEDARTWAAALCDCLAAFLRLPGAQLAAPQVGQLWSRLGVRPVFGLGLDVTTAQYFKLALLAQPDAAKALVAPLQVAPNPPDEVRFAHASMFCPASFEEEPPTVAAPFFFPEPARAPARAGLDPSMLRPPGAESFFGDSPVARAAQPLRQSFSVGGFPGTEADPLSDTMGLAVDEAELAEAAAAAGIALPDPSSMAPRLRLDRVQAVIQSQSASLFGELTVYDAMERRLWDEFDERGAIDDPDVLRQRDAAAIRCLSALDREIDGAGIAGRELPAALAEARAKFSRLCELIVGGAAAKASGRLRDLEAALLRAEDDLVEARAAHLRHAVQRRRRGDPPPISAPEAMEARAALQRAHALLVVELRRIAGRAALGLVEVVGTRGLARALRAVSRAHGDPLLEHLQRHTRWATVQAESDELDPPVVSAAPEPRRATAAPPPRVQREPDAEEDEAYARPEGLDGYTDLRAGDGLRAARRRGVPVALKEHADGKAASCRRELRALKSLRHDGVLRLQGAFSHRSALYLELEWCAGGTLEAWCEQHAGVVEGADAESFVRCLGIFRQFWSAIAYVHGRGAIHGELALAHVLLTADHRPVLCHFERCVWAPEGGEDGWSALARPPSDYIAPELADWGRASGQVAPTAAVDLYAAGAMMAKAFLGLRLEVAACPYDAARGLRRLPDDRLDVDLADLLQALLAQSPALRPPAAAAFAHHGLEPVNFLRRSGLLGCVGGKRAASPIESFLAAAEQLRDDHRAGRRAEAQSGGRRADEPRMFGRQTVFDEIVSSDVCDWSEEELLGEWRVMLNDESGVDGGGLRREVVSLFFEQFESSPLVLRVGADDGAAALAPTLFVADRLRADKSPQQWRKMWMSVGAMTLRAVVHFGNAPIALSSAVFDCAFGRLGRLPPDLGDDSESPGAQLARLRESRGDDWARSQLLDLLRRLRRADALKEAGYRWMLAQRGIAPARGEGPRGGAGLLTVPGDAVETFAAMLEPQSMDFLRAHSEAGGDGSVAHAGAVLEWALLWDVYLKYLGGGDRWVAYDALVEGLTAKGKRLDLWARLTGEQTVEVFDGASLTPSAVVANLEFKPNYGYDAQINSFKRVVETFDERELSMFLRFATGIGKLPANRRFPAGQRLTIRFLPDNLDHLPSAHTCFWTVDLPPYQDEADMADKLRLAIAAPQPFALS